MLQKLVDKQIILLSDDSHFDKLKKAATELTKRLQKSKPKTQAFIFAAIDSNISASSPEITEVQEIVTKGWTTFASTAKDSAVAYIRAVILEALENLSQDENYASLIFLSAKNIIRFKTLSPSEKQIVEDFLGAIGDRLQQKAELQWGMTLTPDLAGFKSAITYSGIDRAKLESAIKAASATSENGGENPYGAESASWPTFFSKKSASGIADEVARTVKSTASEIVNNQVALLKYFDSIVKSQDIRSKLIWWKEAGYSSRLKAPYKNLNSGIIEIALASDYSSFLPINSPASAKYFLLNAYKSFLQNTKGNVEISFSDFISKVQAGKNNLKGIVISNEKIGSKISLIQFLNGLIDDKFNEAQFEILTGIASTQKIPTDDLIVWLYDDNQVEKILNL